ncbi:hypothetical protein [Streptomyces lancefieldiae]|uniref:Secreted protein n=1 Tax=Streptomyces lancefieldiae TaxID=3075520 RepID=A0ABU3AM63_9ACTN|nr:hypothetical protein [Streptomyces sp. DSM 40712]MDT0611043.1 hypothetical protein [Streptomyces sp. DSM 40712]
MSRSSGITAAVAAAAALTATGITYATAAPDSQAVPAVVQQAPAQAPTGGDPGTNNNSNNSKGNEGNNQGGRDHDKRDDHDRDDRDRGWVQINERSYSAQSSGCVVIASGLGSRSLNIRNDSRKTIEVFNGLTCDNGAPIATVGPHSSANGVVPDCVEGVFVKDGVIGSFRVIEHGKGDKGDY